MMRSSTNRPSYSRVSPSDSPNKMPGQYYKETLIYSLVSFCLVAFWLTCGVLDMEMTSGRWPDGFFALYSPPMTIAFVTVLIGNKMRSRHVTGATSSQMEDTKYYTRVSRTRDYYTIFTALLLSVTLLVADSGDHCVKNKGTPGCVVDWNQEYWPAVPFMVLFWFAIGGWYLEAVLGSGEGLNPRKVKSDNEVYRNRWKITHWALSVAFFGMLVAAAVIDIMAASESGQEGWTGRNAGQYAAPAVFVLCALTLLHLATTGLTIRHYLMD